MIQALFGLVACSGPTTPPEPSPVRPHVVVVTLDTTRADRLGAYGHALATTPTFDAMAAAGLRFERAYSPLPLTIPAHASLFTGLTPPHHGVRDNGGAVLDAAHETLAEHLSRAGWSTCASVSAFVTQARWGLNQGFDTYNDTLPQSSNPQEPWGQERRADAVIDDALSCWGERPPEQPSMIWVHLYDAHDPWLAPEAQRAQHPGRPYDAELAYVDTQLARLAQAVSADSRPTLWVLAGDHGESLGEHGEGHHGWYVYDATQRVPLVLSGHGVDPGVVDQPVGLVDVLPTVLDLLDLPVPGGLDGAVQPGHPQPLSLESYQLLDRFGYAPHVGVVHDGWKLIATPRPELYDLARDPGETANLADQQPARLAALQALLAGLDAPPPQEASTLDAQTLAQLQALGYVSGIGGHSAADAPDPKDRTQVLAWLQQAQRTQRAGQSAEALALLEQVLAADPTLDDARLRLAQLHAGQGRLDLARDAVFDGLVDGAGAPSLIRHGASALGTAGDHASALLLVEEGLRRDPDDPIVQEFLLASLLNLGRPADAAARGLGLDLDPAAHPATSALLGLALARSGRLPEARLWLEAGLTGAVVPQGTRVALSVLVSTPQEALALAEAELSEHPESLEALARAAGLHAHLGQYAESLARADALVALSPGIASHHHAQAQALFNLRRYDACGSALGVGLGHAPDDPHLVMLLANLQHKQGKADQALATRARAQALMDAGQAPEQKSRTP